MTERIKKLREYIVSGAHRVLRTDKLPNEQNYLPYADNEPEKCLALYLKELLSTQDPIIIPDERIVVTRSTKYKRPDAPVALPNYTPENGWICNISPDYSYILDNGIEKVKLDIATSANKHPERAAYAEVLTDVCNSVLEFTEKYRVEAEKQGLDEIAERLSRVPAYAPQSYADALQSLRIIHFCLWMSGNHHVTLGRFDQYMYKYLIADINSGKLSREEALELTEDFFISCNKDSDLYAGIQQGDNGQSLVIGGCDKDGNDVFNILSELVMEASCELCVIDPKINLRVNSDTPAERYELATKLTVKGLGFPQYSNDDVVIPGLMRLGYSEEDARNYVVAACWEFIIPRRGMEIPNIGWLSFPECVNRVIHEKLADCEDFATFLCEIDAEIDRSCAKFQDEFYKVSFRPAPFMSLMMDGCIDELRDVSTFSTCKYKNYGIHGVGVAPAADSIAAVNSLVFNGNMSPEELVRALDANFEGYDQLRNKMLRDLPHVGNDDDAVDGYACMLLNSFSEALSKLSNAYGGGYRAGTGSALMYVKCGQDEGATADGRKAGEYLPANYSPSLGIKLNGPMSIIKSFTKPELEKVINGGPLTLEFAASSIRGEEGLKKLAALVRSFVLLGGHQLQLNVINRDSLLDAQQHPEKYRNLIVRVWGWSGYFVELDREYQEQIIKRTELAI